MVFAFYPPFLGRHGYSMTHSKKSIFFLDSALVSAILGAKIAVTVRTDGRTYVRTYVRTDGKFQKIAFFALFPDNSVPFYPSF